MRKERLYNLALEKWGGDAQLKVLVEEIGELLKAFMKFVNRGEGSLDAISEEICDVEIMLEQLKQMLSIEYKVNEEKLKKLKKLAELLSDNTTDESCDMKENCKEEYCCGHEECYG